MAERCKPQHNKGKSNFSQTFDLYIRFFKGAMDNLCIADSQGQLLNLNTRANQRAR